MKREETSFLLNIVLNDLNKIVIDLNYKFYRKNRNKLGLDWQNPFFFLNYIYIERRRKDEILCIRIN